MPPYQVGRIAWHQHESPLRALAKWQQAAAECAKLSSICWTRRKGATTARMLTAHRRKCLAQRASSVADSVL